VFRQHAVHDVLVDVDPECLRDDARNSWTAEPRIARLELDDRLDECLVRPFRTGLLRTWRGGEQPAVFSTRQSLMKCEERRGAQGDGDLSDASSAEEERLKSAEEPVAQRQAGRPPATTTKHDKLLLEEETLSDHRSHATRATQLRGCDNEVERGEQEVPHARVSVRRTRGIAQRCQIPDSAPEFSIRDAKVVGCRAVPLSTETGVAMAFDESAADTTTRPERCRISVKTALRNTALSDLADEGRQADTEVAFTRAEAVQALVLMQDSMALCTRRKRCR
jgi:hypothetical protein